MNGERRFWSKVDKAGPAPEHRPELGPCWLWLAAKNYKGYGLFSDQRVRWVAHRFAWHLAGRSIPEGLQLDHLCSVRHCVNPAHLEPVTPAENTHRGSMVKLTMEDVRAIRASDERPSHLAKRYGVYPNTIHAILRGRTWKDNDVPVIPLASTPREVS